MPSKILSLYCWLSDVKSWTPKFCTGILQKAESTSLVEDTGASVLVPLKQRERDAGLHEMNGQCSLRSIQDPDELDLA